MVVWFCSCHRKIPPALKNMLQKIVGKPKGQQLKVLYPKVWECCENIQALKNSTV
ncbi:hypothetical protein DEO72_LG3g1128 [Vigna unguiculata]|uniref:Uncharacterized protein n=1 Tax=Vigna unguiculata TaxID=3917 RepID=A0A4D6LEA7_VIGUN|nr:hypothetical protein DEO72_LG3g1128 [Vigna unguiculata]